MALLRVDPSRPRRSNDLPVTIGYGSKPLLELARLVRMAVEPLGKALRSSPGKPKWQLWRPIAASRKTFPTGRLLPGAHPTETNSHGVSALTLGRLKALDVRLYGVVHTYILVALGMGHSRCVTALSYMRRFGSVNCPERTHPPDHAKDRGKCFLSHCYVDCISPAEAGNSPFTRSYESSRRGVGRRTRYHPRQL